MLFCRDEKKVKFRSPVDEVVTKLYIFHDVRKHYSFM